VLRAEISDADLAIGVLYFAVKAADPRILHPEIGIFMSTNSCWQPIKPEVRRARQSI
jgi:hypothetical protein